jgi:hydrogenase 3 maturation protease
MLELDLKTTIKSHLDGAEKIAVLGVGSELRADDIAGMLVTRELEERFIPNQGNTPQLAIFHGATAPENLTGEIKKYSPTHLIIVDAADTGAEPGTIMFINKEDVLGISFSTHMMPLKLMIDYLLQSFTCKVIIIGIQPKSLHFGAAPSKEVEESVQQIADAIGDFLVVAKK